MKVEAENLASSNNSLREQDNDLSREERQIKTNLKETKSHTRNTIVILFSIINFVNFQLTASF